MSKDSHGIFQRMRMMLKAAEAASDNIQALFLTDGHQAENAEHLNQVREWLANHFGPKIDVQIRKIQFRPGITSSLPFRLGDYFGLPPLKTLTQPSLVLLSEHVSALKPDLIVAHRLEMFRAIRMATPSTRIPIDFDLDDIEHLAFARSVLSPPHYRSKPIRLAHVLPVLIEELKALRQCRHVYVCSDVDNAKLRRWAPNSGVITIPNGVAKPTNVDKVLSGASSLEVLFVGVLEYPPNAIGMDWFLNNVWPLVISELPAARLNIVGKGGNLLIIPDSVKSSIVVHGFVDSLAAMYQTAKVAICPLLSGGGTRIKIIEAASYRTPMVSTHVGAEGLAFENGKSINLADTPEEFAAAIIKTLANQSHSRALGEAAYSVFENLYERDRIVRKITQSMTQAVHDA